mmetsp:Transcript_16251/g.32105  ORF Transcript_16251/g.32105 Transcript_16251/m.32105 type:complete len:92 (-) Transcript_16251:1603-1878(-)
MEDEDKDAGFLCPISLTTMQDPVMTCDGWTFERREIEAWLKEHSTSPLTRAQVLGAQPCLEGGNCCQVRSFALPGGGEEVADTCSHGGDKQ